MREEELCQFLCLGRHFSEVFKGCVCAIQFAAGLHSRIGLCMLLGQLTFYTVRGEQEAGSVAGGDLGDTPCWWERPDQLLFRQ